VPNRLTSFNIHSITRGIDGIGEVTTQLEQAASKEVCAPHAATR
jgi:hypothetical protein